MRRAFTVALLAASFVLAAQACGTSYDEATPIADASADPSVEETGEADTGADAPISDAEARCNPAAAFGAPVLVTGLPSFVMSFQLSPDEKIAWYVRDRTLFRAAVTSPSAIGLPEAISVQYADPDASAAAPASISLSDDAETLFFEEGFNMFIAQRIADGGYGNASALAPKHGHPFFDAPRGVLFATKYVDASIEDQEIVAGTVMGTMVKALAPIGISPNATTPVPAPDGAGLYFAARMPLRDYDILFTALPVVPDAAVAVGNVSGATAERPQWISRDGCLLYLISARDNVFGQIYVSQRSK